VVAGSGLAQIQSATMLLLLSSFTVDVEHWRKSLSPPSTGEASRCSPPSTTPLPPPCRIFSRRWI
jgi:hypothetical protein